MHFISTNTRSINKCAVIIASVLMFMMMGVCGYASDSVQSGDADGSDPAAPAVSAAEPEGITDSNGTSYGNTQGLSDLLSNMSEGAQTVSQTTSVPDIMPAATDINGASGSASTPDVNTAASSSQTQSQTVQTASSAPRTGVQMPDTTVLVFIIALSAVIISVTLLIAYKKRWK